MARPPATTAAEAVRREVADWDNDEAAAAVRFKALSGQRCDWEHKYVFWRDLIINVARRLGIVAICPSDVKNIWFARGGLTPLCIDRVLQEMYADGEILLRGDLIDPTSGRLYRMLRKVRRTVGMSRKLDLELNGEEPIILKTLLEERANAIIKILADSHWTSSCVVTLEKFQEICEGSDETFMILSYLSEYGKASYFSIRRQNIIEGIKVSLVPAPLSAASIVSLDYDTLHLNWTAEMLQKQLDVIDRQYNSARKLALAHLKLGNKQAALRHLRQSKIFMDSRVKYGSLLDRVEEVLSLIANAESIKKVSEAIQIGVRAIKDSNINSIDEFNVNYQELDNAILSQREISNAIESMPLKTVDVEDEDVEDEFKKLEIELADEFHQVHNPPDHAEDSGTGKAPAESLCQSLSNLHLEPA